MSIMKTSYHLMKNGVRIEILAVEALRMPDILNDHPMIGLVNQHGCSPSSIYMLTPHVVVMSAPGSADIWQLVEEGFNWLSDAERLALCEQTRSH